MRFRHYIIVVALTISYYSQIVESSPLIHTWNQDSGAKHRRQRTQVSQENRDKYGSHVQFAADAYCPGLESGHRAGNDGVVLWKAGNGDDVQRVYVAHSPSLGIVVAYEGTNLSSASSIANDLRFLPDPPRPGLEWIGGEARIARAVQEAWSETTEQVHAQVLSALDRFPDADVVTTGHSFGASIALLDGLSLSHRLKRDISAILFGMPRTGNEKFAAAVDEYLPRQRHIVHFRDPIPHLPPHSAGFEHPAGEVFIADEEGQAVYDCQSKEDRECSYGLLLYRLSDHHGPYFGHSMSCQRSPPLF